MNNELEIHLGFKKKMFLAITINILTFIIQSSIIFSFLSSSIALWENLYSDRKSKFSSVITGHHRSFFYFIPMFFLIYQWSLQY